MGADSEELKKAADAATQQFAALLTGFLLVSSYLYVSLIQISDTDFLTGRGQMLPIIGVSVSTEVFFWASGALLLTLHLGLLVQWKIYRDKVQRFIGSLADRSASVRVTQIQSLLPSIVTPYLDPTVQAASVRWAATTLTFVAVILLPFVLLVVMQVRSLAFHLSDLTTLERLWVLVDLAAVWIYFPAYISLPWSTVSRIVWMSLSALTVAYVSFDAVVPADDVQSLDNPCTWRDFRRTCNLTDRFVRQRRLYLAGQTLRATSSSDTKAGEGGSPAVLNLEGTDLRFAELGHATVIRAALYGAQLEGAHLVGTKFVNSTFQPSGVPRALWGRTHHGATNFSFAYASLADFTGHDLHEVIFTGASLVGAKLTGCDLLKARFDAASLDAADLRVAYLTGARLVLASLIRADLRFAVLSGANLTGGDLRGALLYRNPLFGTTLDLADLTYATAIAPDEDELKDLRKTLADSGTGSAANYQPLQMLDLLTSSGQQIYLRMLLTLHGEYAWLLNFDYLPIPSYLVSNLGQPLSTHDYVEVLQGYIRAYLKETPELGRALNRRRVLEQLLVPTIVADGKVLRIGEPNSPPIEAVREAMLDRVTSLELRGVGNAQSPDARYEPFDDGATSVKRAVSPDPQWLGRFLTMMSDAKTERNASTATLVADFLPKHTSPDATALAVAVRLAGVHPQALDETTRQAFLNAADTSQMDPETLTAVAVLMPQESPERRKLLERASGLAAAAAAELGMASGDKALIRHAMELGSVPVAASIGVSTYVDPKSSDSVKREGWQQLTYAAYRGEINAQAAVGLLLSQAGDYKNARRWLASAAAEGEVAVVNPFAYFLATCPDAKYRDGGLALQLATDDVRQVVAGLTKDQRLKEGQRDVTLETVYQTLAIAYAATGDFTEAVTVEQKVRDLARRGASDRERSDMQAKLSAFKEKRPWLDYPFND